MPSITIDLPDRTHALLLHMLKGDASAIPAAAVHLIRRALLEKDDSGHLRDRRPADERVRAVLPRVLAPHVGRTLTMSALRTSLGMGARLDVEAALPAAMAELGWVRVANGGSILRWAHKDHIPEGFSVA